MLRWENVQLPVCIALGLVPGSYALWSHHRLAGQIQEASFLERHFTAQRTLGRMIGLIAMLGVAAGAGRWELVTIGSMTVGLLVGGYPARRTVWGESWGFLTYASASLRRILAHYGFPLLVALGPILALRVRVDPQLKTFVFLMVLVGWAIGARRLLPALLGARALEDKELLARFREIVARSSVPMPQVLSAGAPGGTLANALALRSRRGSQVMFGATLLETLAPAEIAAIFAHELAHLEEFARRKGRGRGLRAYALMLAAAAVLFFGDGTGHVTALSLLWLTASATVLARSLPHRRAEEVESDRRAVELCGDGETYARALIRLHALARIPRRWAADFERRTTHPSLARRLAAIRGRGPSDQPPPLIVTGPSRTGPVAVLDAEGCRWYAEAQGMVSPDALPVTARLTAQRRYEDLVELRLHATGAEPTALLATGKDGQTWSVRLGPDDARRVQAYLDRIDHRLGEPSEERPDEPKEIPERPPDPPVEWRAGGRRAFAIWLGVVLGIFGLLQVIRLLAR